MDDPIWCKFSVLSKPFLRLLIVRTGRDVVNCFYSKVLTLVNLMNRRGGKLEIISNSLC